MLNYLEKLFPETLLWAKRLPTTVKVCLLVALVAVPPCLAFALKHRDRIASVLSSQILLPAWIPVLALALLLPAALTGILVIRTVRRHSRLAVFHDEWLGFRRHLELFYLHIDEYLGLSAAGQAADGWPAVQDMLPEYYQRRSRLRELLHLMGEHALVMRRSPHWEALKRKGGVFVEREYESPFSFLLDLDPPIYAVGHYGDAIWAALSIADEYIEFMRYQHRFLKRRGPHVATENV